MDKTDAYTDFILKVVSDVKVTPKSDVPAMEKKVREDDKYAKDGGYGEGYNDVADWNIGDTVPYKLIGTIPDEEAMDAYDEYYYAFHDNLTDKFTLIGDSVKVYIASDKSGTDKAEIDGSLWNLTPTENGYTLSFDNLKDIPGIDLRRTQRLVCRVTRLMLILSFPIILTLAGRIPQDRLQKTRSLYLLIC